jgi:hypothetical protein
MAISEESRHQLYQRLEQVLGGPEATTLMEHLPPVGWADVATRRDLDALEQRMDLRFARVEDRFTAVDHRFDAVELRLDRMDSRLDRMDGRLDGMDGRFDQLHREIRTWSIAVVSIVVTFMAGMLAVLKL